MFCPCGSTQLFGVCCEPYLLETALPPTAEALMRSRYSAFATQNSDYILKTEADTLHEGMTSERLKAELKLQQWVGLEVLQSSEKSVKFIASSIIEERLYTISEHSLFEKYEDRWIYTKALEQKSFDKPLQRNEVCPCGSGKKYKKCHQKG